MASLYNISQDILAIYDKIDQQEGEIFPEDEQALMITKEEFTDLILEHKNWDNRLNDVEDILGITPLEIDWIEYCSKLFDKTLYFLYTPIAC